FHRVVSTTRHPSLHRPSKTRVFVLATQPSKAVGTWELWRHHDVPIGFARAARTRPHGSGTSRPTAPVRPHASSPATRSQSLPWPSAPTGGGSSSAAAAPPHGSGH